MSNSNVHLSSFKIDSSLLRLVSIDTMQRYGVIPLEIKDGKLSVAMSNPGDFSAIDHIQILTGYELEILKVGKSSINDFLREHGHDGMDHPIHKDLVELSTAPIVETSGLGESHAIKIVHKLFDLGLKMRASDIHLEPQKSGLYVRYRIDGTLRTVHEFPKNLQPSIISRIKVLANMNITEKRLPQDGQINHQKNEKEIDIRISTLPSKYGEKVSIRLLDKSNMTVGLDSLGFDPVIQSQIETLIDRPHGLLLVTGPTGSGKTTTLYSVIQRLKSPMKNIITLEDPIEYELLANSSNEAGVTQVQVNPKIGLSFAEGLRSSLRQDPDIIMVGEIRDKETAEIAMKASMTGHLVVSSLHTNDAPSTLGRLTDMEIEPYLITSTVIGVLAQRLVRVLCEHCKQPYQPPAKSLKDLIPHKKGNRSEVILFRAGSCSRCQGTGYWGRRGIFELLVMSGPLKKLVNKGGSIDQIRKRASLEGLKTLRSSGLELLLKGTTTVEEVFRSTVE